MRLKVTSLPKRKQKFRHIVFSIEMRFQQLVIKSGCQSLERVQISESPAFLCCDKIDHDFCQISAVLSKSFQKSTWKLQLKAVG